MSTRVAWSPQQLALFNRKDLASKPPLARKPPPAPERSTHIAIADLLRVAARPDVFWTTLEAGEYRTKETAALLKRRGVKAGIPDLMFLSKNGVAFLELKRGNLGRLSPAQQFFGSLMLDYEIPYAVARSYAEAEAQLRQWGMLR